MPKAFQKLPRSALRDNEGHRLFQLVADHISEQADHPRLFVDLERLGRAPAEAQTIFWLWAFQCEAGGGGIEVFVINGLGIYSPQVCGAFEAVGASELARRLKAAIPHARASCAEFNLLKDRSWFDNLEPVAEFPTLQSVDKGVYPVIDQLSDAAATFIKSNADALFSE